MKATLIKKAEGWYNLYQDKIGIGSTHPELQGYKLSKQNCDEIFGVVDVEKLFNEVDETIDFREFCSTSFKLGFNKAMELNKDKQFTLGDMKRAFNCGRDLESIDRFEDWRTFTHFINSLEPTEIEVEVEMESMNIDEIREQGKGFLNANTKKPKLDENGCLILKK